MIYERSYPLSFFSQSIFRLERREFELDVEEQNRRIEEGKEKVADLKMELQV